MAGVDYIREKQKAKSGAASQPEKVEKAQPIVVEAYVPLEVAYTGGSVEVQVVRIASCTPCGGSGTAPGAQYLQPMQCPNCDGQGGAPQYVQYGHMIVEQRAPCTVCAGRGLVLPSSALCTSCGGEQLVEEEARIPFEIPPGVSERERLVAKGQGHAMPGLSAGDVTLVCRMQEHERFLRKGDDLLTEHSVPLQVAICGGAFDVPLLSGHNVRVRLPRGCVLQPGSVKCVPGEGMPKRQNPHLRGDLVVRFGVDFPESLSEATAARLSTAFTTGDNEVVDDPQPPGKEPLEVPPTPDRQEGEVYLSDFDMEQFGKSLVGAREAYEDADEGEQDRAKAAAAEAAWSQPRPFYGHGGYSYGQDFGGFVPPSGGGCRQM